MPRRPPGLAIAMAIVVIVVAIAIIVIASNNSNDSASSAASTSSAADQTPPRANVDHFHAAFSIAICGVELPPLGDADVDREGIHTHGDGVIHIHPFVETVAGDRATLSVFLRQVGVELTDDTLTLPDGANRVEGRDRCDGTAAELVALVWLNAANADAGQPPDETHTTDMGAVRLRDGEAITIALRAKDATVPGPKNAALRLAGVQDIGPANSTTTTAPTATTTP